MRSSFKKGAISFETIIGLIILLASAVVIIFGIIFAIQGQLTTDFVGSTSCMWSNTAKCGGGLMYDVVPNLCPAITAIEEPVDVEEFTMLLRDAYWMYKKGECDFGTTIDEVYPVYYFTPEEDIDLTKFFEYILKNNKGNPVESVEFSDYNYLEENTEGQTLCFDTEDKNIKSFILAKGEPYYIMYYDSQEETIDDLILITSEPDFDAGYWESRAEYAAIGVGSILFTGPYGELALLSGFTREFTLKDQIEGACLVYGFKPE